MKALFTIEGVVRKGQQRGKALGFPTANIACPETIPSGIYLAVTTYDGKLYPSLTFIGDAKTFKETVFQSETYLLDFDQNLYGKQIQISLLKKIRENQQFPSVQE